MGALRLSDLGDVLTPEEVAAVLKCSRDHVYNMVRRREMPGLKVGNLIRIPKKQFLDYLEGRWRHEEAS